MGIRPHNIIGVYTERVGKKTVLLTKNLTPGITFFDEGIFKEKGKEYRSWDPSRSKLAAAIIKGCPDVGLREGNTVLYLGASHGYTPSYVSDIVGPKGFVFALDFAPRVVRDLVFVCEQRKNMAPLLASAIQPKEFSDKIGGEVDYIFQDIAQRDQVAIFLRNVKTFLKKGGKAFLAVKARSIDVSASPKNIFKRCKAELMKEVIIADYREIGPFQKDHCIFVVKKK